MLSAFKNVSVRAKFLIIASAFLAVSLCSIWGMVEMGTANLMQSMERDHIEFSVRLESLGEKYVRLMKDGFGEARTSANRILNARSDNTSARHIRVILMRSETASTR